MTKQQSVLVIEDNHWFAENTGRILEQAGYKVALAYNGLSAIQLIDDFKPDVIILDVMLTGCTAFVLLHELQSYGDTMKIPVIFCTNLATELAHEDLSAYGVNKVLDKTTMLPGDLVAAVRGVLV